MIIYYIVLLILFFSSIIYKNKTNIYNLNNSARSFVISKLDKAIIFFLMVFLCLGYMTGSDWRNYEVDYEQDFSLRLVEPGYMAYASFFSALGVGFWPFHVVTKCLCFCIYIYIFYKLSENKRDIFYVALLLWYASFGLFLFINCPFRNLIACAIVTLGFTFYLKRNFFLFYIFALLACSFHLSAAPLLFLPFAKFHKLNSRILVILYLVVNLLMCFQSVSSITGYISNYIPILASKVEYYDDNSSGSVISLGSLPRWFCLFLIIKYRGKIVSNFRIGEQLFSLCYLYLLICPIYYVFPMLFRTALFLGPFYVLGFAYSIACCSKDRKKLYRLGTLLIASAVVFSTVRSVYYVPYSNIAQCLFDGKFEGYDYRDNYNFKHTPYKVKYKTIQE